MHSLSVALEEIKLIVRKLFMENELSEEEKNENITSQYNRERYRNLS